MRLIGAATIVFTLALAFGMASFDTAAEAIMTTAMTTARQVATVRPFSRRLAARDVVMITIDACSLTGTGTE